MDSKKFKKSETPQRTKTLYDRTQTVEKAKIQENLRLRRYSTCTAAFKPYKLKKNKPQLIFATNSSTDFSEQTSELTKKAKDIEQKILDSFSQYKSVTSNLIQESNYMHQGIQQLKQDFSQIKSEIFDILSEKNKSNQEIYKIKEYLTVQSRNSTGSDRQTPYTSPYKSKLHSSLLEIKGDLQKLNQRLDKVCRSPEEDIKSVLSDAKNYKNRFQPLILESTEASVTCKSCLMF
jgi:uncharacterized phage infection (PIP) family protein YhgE